jgi:HK97 gp10 family phage protein
VSKTTSVRIEGLDALTTQLQALGKSLGPEKSEPVLLEGAQIIAARVRARAPQGPTGRLKEAVIAKMLPRRGPGPASAIAAVDRKKAPHAGLVEYGHRLVRKGKVIGNVPAKQYFRPAVDETQAAVTELVMSKLQNLVEEAVK